MPLTANFFLLCNVGAREAKDRLLFFTESHCIAEPECLEELVRFFAMHDYDSACCRSMYICPSALPRMQKRLFEEGYKPFFLK
ncbi:glycosyltransferase, partial [Pseudenterobacter timonensis]|uniref:glycosyltransferase n=1 Tax=Pseudenterobacter timonensis TaxID=1755099 RepID=UPI003CE55A1A